MTRAGVPGPNHNEVRAMSIRLQELHPTLVHYPLSFFPLAVVSDFLGLLTGRRWLMKAGATMMPIAAASGVVAAAAGLVAQEAVETNQESHDMLVTHRNLNLMLVASTALLAIARGRREEPSIPYVAAGFLGMAAMSYTAYLGGKMVYDHGVGVRAAGGTRPGAAPEIRRGMLREAGRVAAHHAGHALQHAAHELRDKQIAPALRLHTRTQAGGSDPGSSVAG